MNPRKKQAALARRRARKAAAMRGHIPPGAAAPVAVRKSRRAQAQAVAAPGHHPGHMWPNKKLYVQQAYGIQPLFYKLK